MIFLRRVWAAIKYAFTFRWLRKKERPLVLFSIPVEGPPVGEEKFIGMKDIRVEKYKTLLRKLDECLYGTYYERKNANGVTRLAHKQDGWRHGRTHPFDLDGKIYTGTLNNDQNVALYEELRMKIHQKFGIKEGD